MSELWFLSFDILIGQNWSRSRKSCNLSLSIEPSSLQISSSSFCSQSSGNMFLYLWSYYFQASKGMGVSKYIKYNSCFIWFSGL